MWEVLLGLSLYHQVDYHDVDVEIYDLEIEEIDAILSKYGHVNRIGKSFGILKLDTLPHFDFAMPRKESKSGKHIVNLMSQFIKIRFKRSL